MSIETGAKNRLLIVDDEPTNIHILSNILSEDYEIRAANNGERAIEAAKSQSPDLILLDMIMPGLEAGDTYDKLKAVNPAIKVLLSSGYGLDQKASAIIDRGCNGFIQKPFNMKILEDKIGGILK